MFDYIDYTLILCGCKLFINSTISKVVNNVFFAYYILDTLYTLIGMFKIFTLGDISHFIEYLVFVASGLVTVLLLRKKRAAILSLANEIKRFETPVIKRKLRHLSLILSVSHWMLTTSAISTHSMMSYGNLAKQVGLIDYCDSGRCSILIQSIAINRLLFYIFVREQFMKMSSMVYCYHAYAIELITQDGINFQDIHKMVDIRDLVSFNTRMNNLRTKFNAIYNIFPFINYSYLFLGMAGMISDCSKSPIDLVSISYIAMFGQHVIVQLVMTLTINRQIKSTMSVVDRKFHEISHMTNNFALLVYLKSELSTFVDYTAADLFSLKNEFILSFVGGLVSFTVMFLQLSTPGVV